MDKADFNSQPIYCQPGQAAGNITMPPAPPRQVKARLDASYSSTDTAAHWWKSSMNSRAGLAIGPLDRKTAREKTREEVLNSENAGGLVSAFSLLLGSTGPQVRMHRGSQEFKSFVQSRYASWSKKRKHGQIARLQFACLPMDGESLSIWSYNPKRRICPTNLNIIEPARLGNPNGLPDTEYMQGGIFYDSWGNPEKYSIYNTPKYNTQGYNPSDFSEYPADQVAYMIEPKLPEQKNGLAWLAASVENLGRVRDIKNAYHELIKTQSSITGVISPKIGGGDNEEDFAYDAWTNSPIKRNTWMMASPETTVTAFESKANSIPFESVLLNSLQSSGHAIGLPRNSATGSSNEYNFSSARRDDAKLELLRSVFHQLAEATIWDRDFELFYDCIFPELVERFGYNNIIDLDDIKDDCFSYSFFWQTLQDIDQEKTAKANEIDVRSGAKTVEQIVDERGGDGLQHVQDVIAERVSLGVPEKQEVEVDIGSQTV
jgi:capsid protein